MAAPNIPQEDPKKEARAFRNAMLLKAAGFVSVNAGGSDPSEFLLETKGGRKLLNDAGVETPKFLEGKLLGDIRPSKSSRNGLRDKLINNAKAQTPPIPFDAGNRTQFKTYPQLMADYGKLIKGENVSLAAQKSLRKYIKKVGEKNGKLPEKLREKYTRYLDNKLNNVLDKDHNCITETYDPFKQDGRNIYFLTSYNSDPTINENIAGTPDTDEIPEEAYEGILTQRDIDKLNLEFDRDSGTIVTHSVSQEVRDKFAATMPVLPYGYIMAASVKDNEGSDVLIEDVNNYRFMEDSNAQTSAIERYIATLVDKNINIKTRPDKFNIYITNDLVERLPEESQELLERSVLSKAELNRKILKTLKNLNSKIIKLAKKDNPEAKELDSSLIIEKLEKNKTFNLTGYLLSWLGMNNTEKVDLGIKAERIKAVLTVIKYFNREKPEASGKDAIPVYPDELTKLFKESTEDINSYRGLGFKSTQLHH